MPTLARERRWTRGAKMTRARRAKFAAIGPARGLRCLWRMRLSLFILLVGCAHAPLRTVSLQEPTRALGTWYEIASLKPLEKDCTGTTATYLPRADQQIDVINRCRRGSVHGEEALRIAPNDETIIAVGTHYEFAMMGVQSRESLRVLSRRPELDPDLYGNLLARAKEQGFDVSRIKMTPQ
jgi:apolipoprotein D and lipocalin family protein